MLSDHVASPGHSDFLIIPSKPTAPISYTFFAPINGADPLKQRLIVMINGLGLPAASWAPSIASLHSSMKSCPAILSYDRFGQGLTTSRDPIDKDKPTGHDFLDVVRDLHEIITRVVAKMYPDLQARDVDTGKLDLLLVGASIGAPIARLYSQYYPGTVAGLILLDSNIANVNYSDFWPDPESSDFDPTTVVSDDCTLDQYKKERMKLAAMFDLNVKNPEGLDRTTGPTLLPYANSPVLEGPQGVGPLLSVIGHDPEVFEILSFQMMGTPRSLTRKLTNP
jgi:pimeloyl-ACP methyl ester carboxylesterase